MSECSVNLEQTANLKTYCSLYSKCIKQLCIIALKKSFQNISFGYYCISLKVQNFHYLVCLCHERKKVVKLIFYALFNQKHGISHVSTISSVDIKTKQKIYNMPYAVLKTFFSDCTNYYIVRIFFCKN